MSRSGNKCLLISERLTSSDVEGWPVHVGAHQLPQPQNQRQIFEKAECVVIHVPHVSCVTTRVDAPPLDE